MEDHYAKMGFAEASSGEWEREFVHPETGEVLKVAISGRLSEPLVEYVHMGPFVRRKVYRGGPSKAMQSIRQCLKKSGYFL